MARPPSMALPAATAIAVVGAGVGGCALVASLRRGGWKGEISLWESGRGPGGRTATRRSRQDSDLRIDHGAPLFNISGLAPTLLEPLLARGVIEPWREPRARLDAAGRLVGITVSTSSGQAAMLPIALLRTELGTLLGPPSAAGAPPGLPGDEVYAGALAITLQVLFAQ